MINKFLNNKISLSTKKNFSLIIGSDPSKGARSPVLWNKAYKYFKRKEKMFPADVSDKNLENFCRYLKFNKYFLGSSVTIPYKEKIMKYLDTIDENSKAIGSINTILRKKGKLHGLNTDYLGSMDTLKKINIKNIKKNILIFGAGGAGKACIVSATNYFKHSHIWIHNRNKEKLDNFSKKLSNSNKNKIITFSNLSYLKKIKNLDLIINCTSIGFENWMFEKGFFNLKMYCPVSKVNFRSINKKSELNFSSLNKKKIMNNLIETTKFLGNFKNLKIFDIIYQPKETNLLKLGSILGHSTINGLNMNFVQAVKAFKIVNNIKSEKKIIIGMKNGK